jgi:hypothetical protein
MSLLEEQVLIRPTSSPRLPPLLPPSRPLPPPPSSCVANRLVSSAYMIVCLMKLGFPSRKAVSALPPNEKNPPRLDLKISGDDDILSLESTFFETERFLCQDRWHRDGEMREAIRVRFEEKRAHEELDILVQEVNRYVGVKEAVEATCSEDGFEPTQGSRGLRRSGGSGA